MPDDAAGGESGDYSEARRALYEEEAFSDIRECPDCRKAKAAMKKAAHRKGARRPVRRG